MKKITILGLGHHFGDSRIFYKQAFSLSKIFKVKCLWGIFSNKKGNWEENGIKNIGFSGNRLFILFKAWFYGIKNKSDIYVAHDIDSYLVVVGIKLFRWNSKIIFDSHEYYDEMGFSGLNILEKIAMFIFLYILKPLFQFLFSGVTVVTEDMKNYYKNRNQEVIYNFPLSKELSKIKLDKDIEEKYKNNFILIFQGGVSKQRGILLYLEILNKLKNDIPNIKLLILGPISSKDFEQELYSYIEKNNLENYVKILGKLPLFDVYSYTKIAHIGFNFLQPSFNNNHGIQIKIFEYLTLDTPIIGTNNNQNFINFIADNRAGFAINYGNIEEGVEAVKDIYNNYDKYINNCRQIKGDYTWENEEKKLLEFYKKIANEK